MEKENVQDWGITYRITFTNLPCVLIYEIKESSDGSQDQFLAPEKQNYKFKSRKKISRGIKVVGRDNTMLTQHCCIM